MGEETGPGKALASPCDCTGDVCPYAGDIAVSKRGFGCGRVHQSNLLQPVFYPESPRVWTWIFQHHP